MNRPFHYLPLWCLRLQQYLSAAECRLKGHELLPSGRCMHCDRFLTHCFHCSRLMSQ